MSFMPVTGMGNPFGMPAQQPGLLGGGFSNFLQSPGAMGLAQGLLAASGPSRTPISLGQAFGMGLGQMQAATGNAQKQALLGMQIRQMQQKEQAQKAWQDYVSGKMNPTPQAPQPTTTMTPGGPVTSTPLPSYPDAPAPLQPGQNPDAVLSSQPSGGLLSDITHDPKGMGLLMQANPDLAFKLMTLGNNVSASDLVQVPGPNGPVYIPASQAIGKAAYQKPEAPIVKSMQVGDQTVTKQWNPLTRTWDQLASGQKGPLVTVNTGDKGMTKLSQTMGSDFIEKQRPAALDALNGLRTNMNAEKLLSQGIISGFGADFKLGMGKALQTAGIHIADDPVANTEAYAAVTAQNVGRVIKQFGSGTGLSDADREYAQKMVAGQITLNEQSMRKILHIANKAYQNILTQYGSMADQVMSRPGADQLPYDVRLKIPQDIQNYMSGKQSPPSSGKVKFLGFEK